MYDLIKPAGTNEWEKQDAIKMNPNEVTEYKFATYHCQAEVLLPSAWITRPLSDIWKVLHYSNKCGKVNCTSENKYFSNVFVAFGIPY